MSRYADLEELIADLMPELTSEEEQAALGRVLDAVSAFIDDYCKRPRNYFDAAGEEETERRFKGEGKNYLRIPIHVAGSVTVTDASANEIDADLYYESNDKGWLYSTSDEAFYPGNAPFMIDHEFKGIWQLGVTYLVSAQWGYVEIPAAITEAARQITVRWYQTQRGVFGQVTPNGFVIERDLSPSAALLLEPYIKKEFERQ